MRIRWRPDPPLTPVERAAAGVAVVASAVLGTYGLVVGATSVPVYVGSVVVIGALIGRARREPLPSWLAVGLAVQAVANLAGGLVQVGDGVLYNWSLGSYSRSMHTHLLQVDHPVHAFGCFIATLTLWELLVPPVERTGGDRGRLLLLCVLGGFGIGAINETLEFLATVTNHGGHVGGYHNTGWDLVSNTVGVLAAVAVIQLRHRRSVA